MSEVNDWTTDQVVPMGELLLTLRSYKPKQREKIRLDRPPEDDIEPSEPVKKIPGEAMVALEKISVPSAPPCFPCRSQFEEWCRANVSAHVGKKKTERKSGKYVVSMKKLCDDCTPDYRDAMHAQGNCAHPETIFVRGPERLSGADENEADGFGVVAVNATTGWSRYRNKVVNGVEPMVGGVNIRAMINALWLHDVEHAYILEAVRLARIANERAILGLPA